MFISGMMSYFKTKTYYQLNALEPDQTDARHSIITQLFGKIGAGFTIEQNFRCDIGANIEAGDNLYVGYNCVILDIAKVIIGNNCMIASNVGIYTAGHALNPINRNKQGYAIPINIENNVWIGGHSVLLPGVTIGENATVVAGNPAKLLKHIVEN